MLNVQRRRLRFALVSGAVITIGAFLGEDARAQDAGPGSARVDCVGAGFQTACGNNSVAVGTDSTAMGNTAVARGDYNTAVGTNAWAISDGRTTAVGALARATETDSIAIGAVARATASNSVALGANSDADQANTVSVGGSRVGLRRIVNMADGIGDGDAATVGQMKAGDAAILASANTYTDAREGVIRTDMAAGNAATLVAANTYSDTGDAATLTAANTYSDAGDAATLAAANSYADAGDVRTLADANAYSDTGDAVTLTAANTYSDAGDAATLAAANTYADAGDVRTLASANTYADAGDIRTLGRANFYTDQQVTRLETVMNGRFRDVEIRMDQVTAMSAAFAVMAGNNAGAGTGSTNRLVVGVGNYGSETAMSVGYSRAISNRTAFNAGVSFTGGEVMSGGSFGFAW